MNKLKEENEKYKNDNINKEKQIKELENKYRELEQKKNELDNIKKELDIKITELGIKINQLENQLVINKAEFNRTLIYYLDKIKNCSQPLYNDIDLDIQFKKILLYNINKTYTLNGVVNINEIESYIKGGRKWHKNFDKSNEINIGFQLDSSYILRTMMTLASIIDSQKPSTKLRLHFAVVLGFDANNMLKIYSLREKLREDVEFNFYNAQKVENDFKGMHPKGPGAVAKILLPHILPDDIDRLLVFDTGDVLVLRDLSEMYNWNISDYMYMGAPDPCIGNVAQISKKFDVYINIGHYLLNVRKIKAENMYEKYLKYKDVYTHIIADQDLLNDIAQKEIGYLPIKFGLFSPFLNDAESDTLDSKNQYEFYNMSEAKLKNTSFYIPKNSNDYFRLSYNPVVIHQWNGKWQNGEGISIYRRLAQNYIKIAGIWDELCLRLPGYCEK
jgi:hypothetical protein